MLRPSNSDPSGRPGMHSMIKKGPPNGSMRASATKPVARDNPVLRARSARRPHVAPAGHLRLPERVGAQVDRKTDQARPVN